MKLEDLVIPGQSTNVKTSRSVAKTSSRSSEISLQELESPFEHTTPSSFQPIQEIPIPAKPSRSKRRQENAPQAKRKTRENILSPFDIRINPFDDSDSPTLKRYSDKLIEELLLQQLRYEERKDLHVADIGSIATHIDPVPEEVLRYLAACPDDEWDEFWERNNDSAKVERSRIDVNAFLEYAFSDKDGVAWKQEDFHKDWQTIIPTPEEAKLLAQGIKIEVKLLDGETFEKRLTTLIGAPREHAKTTQLSIGRVIWEIGTNPSIRVKIVTANDGLASDIVFDIAQNIERNPRVRKVFPYLEPDYKAGWTKTSLYVKRPYSAGKDATVGAAGVLSTGAGGRADLLIFDDVIDFRNAVANPALREQVGKSIQDTWIPLMPKDGRCWYVATPWHSGDYTHEIKKQAGWAKWWKPAYTEVERAPGKFERISLWPSKWSNIALEIRRSQIQDRAFTRQFLLIALSDEEATFPADTLMQSYDYTAEDLYDCPADWPRFAGLDLAASMSNRGAFTVLFTIAVDPNTQRRYPVEIVRGKMKLPVIIAELVRGWNKHKWQLIYVEDNAFQKAVVDSIEDKYKIIPVKGHTTGANKKSIEVGLPSLSVVFKNGGWSIPNSPLHNGGNADCPCSLCAWKNELRSHPLAQFSDTVMACWFAERAAVDGGSNFEDFYTVTTDNKFQGNVLPVAEQYEIRKPTRFTFIEMEGAKVDDLLFSGKTF